MGDLESKVYTISSEEIETVIKELPKEKACGSDNIAAEKSMGEKGMEVMSRLIHMIQIGTNTRGLQEEYICASPKNQQGSGV